MDFYGLLPATEAPFTDTSAFLADKALQTEGEQREYLARYFLSLPQTARQTEAQREGYRQALRLLSSIENQAVIRHAGHNRPLQYGDLTGLLEAVAEACCRVAAQHEMPLTYTIDDAASLPYFAPFEPRLVQMAAIGLIRAACLVNGGTPVCAAISRQDSGLTFSVTGRLPAQEQEALLVAKETARLHKGSLAVCDGTVAFSLRINSTHYAGIFPGVSPGELMRNPLSSVQIGFYSSLD